MSKTSQWLQAAEEGPPAALREHLLSRARSMRTRSGQIVIALGAESSEVYIVLAGAYEVLITARDGQDVVLRDLGPGAVFGELAALDRLPRSASVTSTSDGALAVVPGADFLAAVSEIPEASRWFMNRLGAEVRRLTEKTFELSALAARSRLHCELLRLAASAPRAGPISKIAPAPTHEALAQRIGSQREMVSREFARLDRAGLLRRGPRYIEIDIDRLGQLVDTELGYRFPLRGNT